MAVSAECKMLRGFSTGDFITTGLQATNDVAGDSRLQRTQVFPVINYHKLLNEDKTTFISLAFMGGPVNEHFDASKLQFDDQYVNGAYSVSNATRQQFGSTGFTYWDASVGVSFKTSLTNNVGMYSWRWIISYCRTADSIYKRIRCSVEPQNGDLMAGFQPG